MFVAKGIDVAACGDLPDDVEKPTAEARGFAVTGGVAGAVASRLAEGIAISCHCVNGLSPQGVAQLRSFVKGKAPATLVEVMTCEGGCVGGAGVLGEKTRTTKAIQKFIKA